MHAEAWAHPDPFCQPTPPWKDPLMSTALSWTTARRIALRAQGMGRSRRTEIPSRAASRRSLQATVERTHLLQIDSVNIFERAHHLPVFTRSGSWDTTVLDRLSRPGPSRLVREALAHEATFASHEVHSLLDFRRRAAAANDWEAVREATASTPQLFSRIFAALEELGPSSASAISRHLGDTDRGEGWGWRRTSSQWAVEYLFRSGGLDCVGRSTQFERLYVPAEDPGPWLTGRGIGSKGDPLDLADGALDLPHGGTPSHDSPADLHNADMHDTESPDANTHETDTHDRDASITALMGLAAKSLGIAEVSSLADYFRVAVRDARTAVDHLLARGVITPVLVDHPAGRREMMLHRDAPSPSPLRTAALVSPFDPIVFHRPRLSRLFDVEYRIGIYTPAAQRATGYYALLFLLGDVFPARVDLKADRARGVLEVRGTFREELPHLPPRQRPADDAVVEALIGELERAAIWQGLDRIEVRTGPGTGALSTELAALCARRGVDVGPVSRPSQKPPET